MYAYYQYSYQISDNISNITTKLAAINIADPTQINDITECSFTLNVSNSSIFSLLTLKSP